MQKEVEEELYSRSFRLEHYVSENNEMLELPPVFEILEVPALQLETLKDTIILDPSQNEEELFRELITYKNINNKNYRITVRSMVVETQEVVFATSASFLFSLLLVFLIQFFFSRTWNQRIWQPFFENLEEMKAFSLRTQKPIKLRESNIKEFSELNEEIEALTSKVTSDYQNLKQFTENISHELQTSLAIMQAKLENFLNESAVTDEQFSQLSSLQKDIQRLGKLNKKLVFLTNLENKSLGDTEAINLNLLVKETVEDFKELSELSIEFKENQQTIINADRELIQVLINNLISNAIKYYDGNSVIRIEIDKNSFLINNPGNSELEHSDKLYDRFYKANNNSKSGSGLGLAIVKKICDLYSYELAYTFKDKCHHFKVKFS